MVSHKKSNFDAICLKPTVPRCKYNPFSCRISVKPIASWLFLFMILCVIPSCSMTSEIFDNDLYPEKPVLGQLIDVAPFNTEIENAIAHDAEWPTSPVLIVLKLLNGDAEVQNLKITLKQNHIEEPYKALVTLIRDGILDDSVKGDYYQFVFSVRQDRTWRIDEIHRAFQCWRENSGFQVEPCP